MQPQKVVITEAFDKTVAPVSIPFGARVILADVYLTSSVSDHQGQSSTVTGKPSNDDGPFAQRGPGSGPLIRCAVC